MAAKYLSLRVKPLTHREVTLTGIDAKGEPISRPFEFTLELYLAALLSDPWWKGDGNENDALARAEANLRIQDALEEAEERGDMVAVLTEGDHRWLLERARAWNPQQPPVSTHFVHKAIRFYKALLSAPSKDPRRAPDCEAQAEERN